MAEGLGNRAIAQRLTLPERTVENRVSQIMRKLDRPLRVAVAAWVRER
ncbi:response regulator transcription factor [Pseudonocardia sp. KRD-184]|uniref:Response regulator transcription factor n=1 Tax=Pseudonocardia oceani TaxID=2792013 RepID=A0ABS6UGK3_9PSEU|nr:response regulator transcription factor [Pseudonocardia oceani]MBW0094724.1 response regulator transcription factor [Pseudonocardia oceani]MBW0107322.1 response regulator transcription factor [Pseudonocardia oceani]MBW0120388.1 response regulator transcription factor [Pseudonocardia oceani]MBW0131358.1 response regulator transcription factor [Pseudonocardia oceani]